MGKLWRAICRLAGIDRGRRRDDRCLQSADAYRGAGFIEGAKDGWAAARRGAKQNLAAFFVDLPPLSKRSDTMKVQKFILSDTGVQPNACIEVAHTIVGHCLFAA
jgi:hypothetical protein